MSTVQLKDEEYEVEIMADSFVQVPIELNSVGYHRLTTLRVVFPRLVLAEFNTHRLLSRNSASSRAIPAQKMRQRVIDHPFVPKRFPKDHKGMQASEWVEQDNPEYEILKHAWLQGRDEVVAISERLSKLEISKQLANRYTETPLMHQVIVTATEWENFFGLRAHSDAQDEIRITAELMLEAMNQSDPVELLPGQWHLPYGDRLDENRVKSLISDQSWHPVIDTDSSAEEAIRYMITVARCARVSYLNFEGKDDYLADVTLYSRLKSQGHMSPFEHVARAMDSQEYEAYSQTYPDHIEYGWCGNFRGFVQLRRMFKRDEESRVEPRLKRLVF